MGSSEHGALLSPKPTEIGCFPSGNFVDLSSPKPETILLEDIAHHLSLICRFSGAVGRFYSVAEHSCLVMDLVSEAVGGSVGAPAGLLGAALLHDASEAYAGDVTSPLKYLMRAKPSLLAPPARMRSRYDMIEDNLQKVIFSKYGLSPKLAEGLEVQAADRLALAHEARELTAAKGEGSPNATFRALAREVQSEPERSLGMAPGEAAWRFLRYANNIGLKDK